MIPLFYVNAFAVQQIRAKLTMAACRSTRERRRLRYFYSEHFRVRVREIEEILMKVCKIAYSLISCIGQLLSFSVSIVVVMLLLRVKQLKSAEYKNNII